MEEEFLERFGRDSGADARRAAAARQPAVDNSQALQQRFADGVGDGAPLLLMIFAQGGALR